MQQIRYLLVQHAPVYCTRLCYFALGCASGKTTNSWAHIALLCIQYPIHNAVVVAVDSFYVNLDPVAMLLLCGLYAIMH